MPKKKISITPCQGQQAVYTFQKRAITTIKKAIELSVLCGVETFLSLEFGGRRIAFTTEGDPQKHAANLAQQFQQEPPWKVYGQADLQKFLEEKEAYSSADFSLSSGSNEVGRTRHRFEEETDELDGLLDAKKFKPDKVDPGTLQLEQMHLPATNNTTTTTTTCATSSSSYMSSTTVTMETNDSQDADSQFSDISQANSQSAPKKCPPRALGRRQPSHGLGNPQVVQQSTANQVSIPPPIHHQQPEQHPHQHQHQQQQPATHPHLTINVPPHPSSTNSTHNWTGNVQSLGSLGSAPSGSPVSVPNPQLMAALGGDRIGAALGYTSSAGMSLGTPTTETRGLFGGGMTVPSPMYCSPTAPGYSFTASPVGSPIVTPTYSFCGPG
eukprot:TRINITY_DN3688_c0_g1_i1.p1 TRINITY_DN3688_c0_g1~~TRINITY_DN3688_c0_g1_i1.p1  ORF type:complete len:383 (+),score=35.01 TRINITY_DN3688_c0_g1_i1:20-1168(+)